MIIEVWVFKNENLRINNLLFCNLIVYSKKTKKIKNQIFKFNTMKVKMVNGLQIELKKMQYYLNKYY